MSTTVEIYCIYILYRENINNDDVDEDDDDDDDDDDDYTHCDDGVKSF